MNVQFTDKTKCIFKSTLLLIKDHGFHGTPMSQIAKHADVAIGTIYHYFPSKDNLILDLFEYCKQELYLYVFKDVNQKMSYKEKFFTVFKNFSDFHIQQREYSCFFEQFYNSPYHEMVGEEENEEGPYAQNVFLKFIHEGIENRHLKSLHEQIICSAYIGTAITYSKNIVNGKIKYNEEQLTDLINIIWDGIKYNN